MNQINQQQNSRSRACGNCGKPTRSPCKSLSYQGFCRNPTCGKLVENLWKLWAGFCGNRTCFSVFHRWGISFPQGFPQNPPFFPQPCPLWNWDSFFFVHRPWAMNHGPDWGITDPSPGPPYPLLAPSPCRDWPGCFPGLWLGPSGRFL